MTEWLDKRPWNRDELKGYSGPLRVWWGEQMREFHDDSWQPITMFAKVNVTHYARQPDRVEIMGEALTALSELLHQSGFLAYEKHREAYERLVKAWEAF